MGCDSRSPECTRKSSGWTATQTRIAAEVAGDIGAGQGELAEIQAAAVASGIERGDGALEKVGDSQQARNFDGCGPVENRARRAALHDAAGFEDDHFIGGGAAQIEIAGDEQDGAGKSRADLLRRAGRRKRARR